MSGPVDQRADNAVQRISVNKTYFAFRRVEIYSVDSVVHPSSNRDQYTNIFISKRNS